MKEGTEPPSQRALGPAWRRSTRSDANGNCVEARLDEGGVVEVRDSKDRSGPTLRFDQHMWKSWLEHLHLDGDREGRH